MAIKINWKQRTDIKNEKYRAIRSIAGMICATVIILALININLFMQFKYNKSYVI